MVSPGHGDHPGRKVDTEGVDAETVRVGGDVSGAAADVGASPI